MVRSGDSVQLSAVMDKLQIRAMLVFTIAFMTVLFFIGGPDYHSPRSFRQLWNLGHIVYFAVFPLLLIPLTSFKNLRPSFQATLIVVLTLVSGALVEWLQYGFNRTPDLGDMFRNLIGAGIAICFFLPATKVAHITYRRIALIVFIVLMTTQFYPVGIALLDEYHARRNFPMLSDFQSPWQIQRWIGDAALTREADIGREGNWSMRTDLTTQQYSGCALKYFPGDWRGYRWLQLRVFNPSAAPIDITCRVHDRLHAHGIQRYADRFNTTRTVSKGWHTITIRLTDVQQAPSERLMDLGHIYGVGIFASRLARPRTIYIDDVQLIQ
jgi:VanZ family protein